MSGERMLLVDDHDGFRSSASALLELEGARVVGTAGSAEEALTAFADVEADVVLIDLFLPGMDGIDLANALAERPGLPPSILISSHEEAGRDPRVARSALRGFVAKRDLTWAAVRRLLG